MDPDLLAFAVFLDRLRHWLGVFERRCLFTELEQRRYVILHQNANVRLN